MVCKRREKIYRIIEHDGKFDNRILNPKGISKKAILFCIEDLESQEWCIDGKEDEQHE
jgi:hypothetical protein